jgi:hypothetical protein
MLSKLRIDGVIVGKAIYETKLTLKITNAIETNNSMPDVKNGRTVKGVNINNLADAGDSVE